MGDNILIHPAQAKDIADGILNELSTFNFPYFIMGGTLLGLYRDGTYIPTDPDLDIAVLKRNEVALVLLAHDYVTDRGKWKYNHFWKHDVLLDIREVKPEGFYAAYDELIYNGIDHPTPYPIEEYLEWKYGDTWRTPMTTGYNLQHEE